MKKRVLIYGNQKCFSKYLKWKFQKVLLFDVYKDSSYLNANLNSYSIIVMVIYREEDLLDFFKLYRIGKPLVVCSFNKRVVNVLNDLEDVFLLDTSKIRSEMLKQLQFYFQDTILSF